MRISAMPDDPDFNPHAWKYRVFLDGVELFNCHTADEEQGIAYCFAGCRDKALCRINTVERHGVVKLQRTDNDHYR